jgi:hydroxysqualene synthase
MMEANNSPEEISSGKDIAYENFPVGSWLLPARLRPHIATFYNFARAADDIADSAELGAEDKIARLVQFEKAVKGNLNSDTTPEKAHGMAASLAETETTPQHCLDLLTAFKQDATKQRYQNWQELINYCQLSAAPVGRYLLDLHGGSKNGYDPSDALCIALQILNHLQDCQDDYQTLDRVYLPLDMLDKHGAKLADLKAPETSLSMRQVFDEILTGVDELMLEAAKLPAGLKSRRLAIESQIIINIANRLSHKLRHNDLLKNRLELSKSQYLACFVAGVVQALFR